MTEQPDTFTLQYFLTAGECDAQGAMPMPLIATRLIEIATAHANALGIGYEALRKFNIGWVLSRLSIEMMRYPGINDAYAVTTWIESINRRFSARNFAILDAGGCPVGYARSVWTAIDFDKRTGADLTAVGVEAAPVAQGMECPIAAAPRIPQLPPEAFLTDYTFRYCDLDFNRHVNTVRYLELLMDSWSLDHYDSHMLRRVDLLFHRECRFGQTADLRRAPAEGVAGAVAQDCELSVDGARMVAARFAWLPKHQQ